ncbi:MAG: hypothetical protein ABR568_19930 [Pyrinomonadaceae bacterium]
MSYCGFGFAAGEARAVPRRKKLLLIRAMPFVRALPHPALGAEPEPWAQPEIKIQLTAGHSPRLTSGGKAEAA